MLLVLLNELWFMEENKSPLKELASKSAKQAGAAEVAMGPGHKALSRWAKSDNLF